MSSWFLWGRSFKNSSHWLEKILFYLFICAVVPDQMKSVVGCQGLLCRTKHTQKSFFYYFKNVNETTPHSLFMSYYIHFVLLPVLYVMVEFLCNHLSAHSCCQVL